MLTLISLSILFFETFLLGKALLMSIDLQSLRVLSLLLSFWLMCYQMTVEVKVSFKDYVKLIYGLTSRKPAMKLILCVAATMLLWITTYYSHILPVPKPIFFQYSTLLLITVIQPVFIYFTIRKNYRSSSMLQEKVTMEFTKTEIKLKGESFYTELIWTKIYKVEELKNWFLIYQNTLSAIVIPKRSLADKQSAAFKKLLQTVLGSNLNPKE